MKQVAQNYRSGELAVIDVPVPRCLPGGVLVRTLFSLISTGTELMKVNESKMSLIGKARSRPEQVAKVLETAAQQGPMSAYRKAMNRLDSYTPLGYSLAGVVVEVGEGAGEFKVGQVVACAGNEFALHAELNWVPRNLCVPVPDGVIPQLAAFATVGAIAMQGVRQGRVQLGDTACVIGLGLIGQLVVQLLVAAGVRVVGLDMVPARCLLAEKSGAALCAAPDPGGLASIEQKLIEMTGGIGADVVFLAAGGSSNAPVEAAARVARDRATIVDIGKCKLDLPWNAYYEKELEVRFSRSYGPGRYDPRYELEGIDYPAGYVRWTERRNLECFLDLIAHGEIDPQPLVSGVFPLDDASSVYDKLQQGTLQGVGFLFECPDTQETGSRLSADDGYARASTRAPHRARRPGTPRKAAGAPLRLGFVGAGNYASSMLLPHLSGREDVDLVQVVTNRSLSAVNAQRKFGFAGAGTDLDAMLSDDTIDAVFVVTRHSSHADLTCRALDAGKAVFVEKPLALDLDELDRILATVDRTGNDRLMVGFNRRFAPMLLEMKARFGATAHGGVARYLVNAGKLSPGSWYRDEESEGSRFVGEGGHFLDTLSWWLESEPVEVSAASCRSDADDLVIHIKYEDGSLAIVTYLTNCNPRTPKEIFDVSAGMRSARMDNFRSAQVWSGRRKRVRRSFGAQDKGQRTAIDAFVRSVRDGAAMPISVDSLVATTRATLAVPASLASGRPEPV
jgi:predicted dehydrogenase/threonine dehydrogenase-like Zn-dependent dehydrogenase